MLRIQQLMKLHRLMKPAGDEGSDAGGTGTGGDAAALAAAAAATAAEAAKAKTDEGTKPTDAEAKLLKDVMKHKARSTELDTLLAQATAQLESFKGIDVEKVRANMAEQEAAEQKRLLAAGDFERLTKQMGDRHVAEKSALELAVAEKASVNAALEKQIADLTVGGAFASSAFVKEDLTLTPNKARVIYGAHYEFKDGKVIGFDKPAGASERTMLVNSTGEALGFEDSMRKLIEADPDRDQLMRSKMKTGSGSTTTKGSKEAGKEQSAALSSVERIAAGLKGLQKQQ